jgi:hypothetical protein
MAIGSPQWMYSSGSDYELEQSLKFNDDDSAYLSWTPSSAGNRKTWTWSGWVKRGNLTGSQMQVFSAGGSNGNNAFVVFEGDNTLLIQQWTSFSNNYYLKTNQVFRDVSAWYHIVLSFDTTQATSSDRIKVWVNGEQVTSFSTATYPSQNFDTRYNSSEVHALGCRSFDNVVFLEGYLAEVNFIDGQALTPADFGETGDYGEWKPKEYSGTYGTNGFYLNFAGGGVMSATGGNSTVTDGDYKAVSFTSDGTFTPSANGYVEYLVVGGGGNGAGFGASSVSGGGGGAGGYRTGYLAVTGGTAYSITVGAATEDSVFSSITSAGGGNGGQPTPSSGGSGGGSGAASPSGAAGTSGQGNTGGTGNGTWGVTTTRSGGGGGSGGVGGNADGSNGGAAGAGTASSITGSSVTYAAGGEGVAHTRNTAGTAGAANTGNGGGGTGGSGGNSGGAGGSGIVIIRYKFQ